MKRVKPVSEENVRAIRLGHGANCSSIGSVIDTLFIAAAASGAVFAVVLAAMRDEDVKVVGDDANEGEREGEREGEGDGEGE